MERPADCAGDGDPSVSVAVHRDRETRGLLARSSLEEGGRCLSCRNWRWQKTSESIERIRNVAFFEKQHVL